MAPTRKTSSSCTVPSNGSHKANKNSAGSRKQKDIRHSPYNIPSLQQQNTVHAQNEMAPFAVEQETGASSSDTFHGNIYDSPDIVPYDEGLTPLDHFSTSFDENDMSIYYGAPLNYSASQFETPQNIDGFDHSPFPSHLAPSSTFDAVPEDFSQLPPEIPVNDNIGSNFNWLINNPEDYLQGQVFPSVYNIKDPQVYLPVHTQMEIMSVSEPATCFDWTFAHQDSLAASSNVPPLTFDHSSPEDEMDQVDLVHGYPIAFGDLESDETQNYVDEELVGVGLYEDPRSFSRKSGVKAQQNQPVQSEKTTSGKKRLVLEETWEPPASLFNDNQYSGQPTASVATLQPSDCAEHLVGLENLLEGERIKKEEFTGVGSSGGDNNKHFSSGMDSEAINQANMMGPYPDIPLDDDIAVFFDDDFGLESGLEKYWELDAATRNSQY